MNQKTDDEPEHKPTSAANRWGRYLSGYVIAIVLWLLGNWLESYHLRLFAAVIGLGTLMFGTLRVMKKK